jgi:WD40 repeat protein
MAKVTVAFDAWKEAKVAATQHEVAIVLPKKPDLKLEEVSSGIRRELIHPSKSGPLLNMAFAPDGKQLIAGDYPGGVVAVWDVETGKRTTTIETGHGYRSTSHYFFVTPDWKTLFVNRPGNRKLQRVEKNGKQLRRWTYDGAVLSWDLDTGKPSRTYQHDPPRYPVVMAPAPDGSKFVTSESLPGIDEDTPNAMTLWDVKTGKFIELGRNLESYSVFSPDGKTLATAARDKKNYYTTEIMLCGMSKPANSSSWGGTSNRTVSFHPTAKRWRRRRVTRKTTTRPKSCSSTPPQARKSCRSPSRRRTPLSPCRGSPPMARSCWLDSRSST